MMASRRADRIGPAMLGIAALVTAASAHEGHKTEATRGVIRIGNDLFLADEVRAAVGISFGEVALGPVERTLEARARVFAPPERQGFASSRIGGRLRSILVRPGDRVERGQVLGEVESLELEAVQGELLRAKVVLSLEEANLARVRALQAEQNVPEREVFAAETSAKEARVLYEGMRRKLLALGLDDSRIDGVVGTRQTLPSLPVVAPLSGRVVHVDVEVGRIVEPTEHLFHILDLSRVQIEGEVPEDRAAPVRAGMDARAAFAALPGETFPLRVERVAPALEGDLRALRFWAEVENPDEVLRPEMSGVITVVLERETGATLAPRAAVVRRGAAWFAFVEEALSDTDRENLGKKLEDREEPLPAWAQALAQRTLSEPGARKVSRRLLVLGRRSPTEVEILDGLYPGDRVVLQGGHLFATLFVQGVLEVPEEVRRNIGLRTEEVLPRVLDEVTAGVAVVDLPPGRRACLSPRLPGKVASVRARVGDAVAAGDTLAEIESLEVEALSLDLITASLRLDLLRSSRERTAKLALAGIPAGREALAAESAVLEQETVAQSLTRRLLSLGVPPERVEESVRDRTPIRTLPIAAPIGGRVSAVRAEIGRVVTPQDRLVEIVDVSKVWLSGAIRERAIEGLREGSRARVRLDARPEEVIEGTVAILGREVSPQERTLPVWIEIENPDLAILPGMRGEIAVRVGVTAEAPVAVPRRALLSEAGRPFVIVEKGETFERVETEVGRADDRYVEVLEGLQPGDRVVVRGGEELRTALASLR